MQFVHLVRPTKDWGRGAVLELIYNKISLWQYLKETVLKFNKNILLYI